MAPWTVCRRLLFLGLGLALLAVPAPVLADKASKTLVTAEEIRAALDQKLTLDFSSQNLEDALNHLHEKTHVNFVLDTMVLQQLGLGGPNEMPAPVRLKGDKSRDRARTTLQRMLEPYHLTYVILGDRVLVTTEDVAHYRQMRQRISVNATEVPVGQALHKLARQAAVNLVIDPRVGGSVKSLVTLEQDDVTLETALRLLTFMADLRAVPIGNVVLVTTEERAEKLTKQTETPRPPLIGGAGEMMEVPAFRGAAPGAGPVPPATAPTGDVKPQALPGGKSSTALPPRCTEQPAEKCCQIDHHTPILPPIVPGKKLLCAAPPDGAVILRALSPVRRGVPPIYEVVRDNIDFTVEKLVDHVDPPRFFPLIGPAQLHHCHYKFTVNYTETVQVRFPYPFEYKQHKTEVVYIDRDHLHTVPAQPDLSGFYSGR